MKGRKQFTFFRSFYDAVTDLPEDVRLGVYEAIIAYALDKKVPEKLEGAQKTAFILVKPVLDASWRKAMGGVNSGKTRRRSCEDTANKKEKEIEEEEENEIENEIEIEIEDECPEGFGAFWELYPVKLGKDKAIEAWKKLRPDPKTVCDGVKKWLQTRQWEKDNGQFIPRAAKFLGERHYEYLPGDHIPQGASGVLGQAELEAIQSIMGAK